MKRTIYLLAFLWAFFGQLNAQFDMESNFSGIGEWPLPNYTLKLDSGQFICVRKAESSKNVVFELLDEQMRTLKFVESDLTDQWSDSGKQKYLRAVEFLGGKLYVFYSTARGGDSYKIYAEELDQHTLSMSGSPIIVGEFEKKVKYEFAQKMHFIKSADEQRLLIYLIENIKIRSKQKIEQIQMLVLDESLKVQWQKSEVRSEPDEYGNYLGAVLNNAGEVFVLERLTMGKLNKLTGKYPVHTFFLYKFDKRGAKSISKELELEGRVANRLRLSMDSNDDLLVCGVFYTANEGNGILYMRFDKLSLRKRRTAFSLFDPEYVAQGYSEKELSDAIEANGKGKPLNLPITIREVIHRPDGGLTILGEKLIIIIKDGRRSYFTNEIFIIHLNEMGKIEWNNKISRKQNAKYIMFSPAPSWGEYKHASFTWANQDDNIILLFNDHGANVQLDKDLKETKQTPFNLDSYFNAVRIDEEGNMEREVVFKSADHGVKIYPAYSKSLSKERGELILVGIHNKIGRLVHLVVE